MVSGTTEDTMGKSKATDANNQAGCGGFFGPDVVYELDLKNRSLLNAALIAPFSSKMYVREAACADGAMVLCADKSFVSDPIEPGKYWIFVDSDSKQAKGDFSLAVSTTPAPLPINDTCDTAKELVFANGKAQLSGTNEFSIDDTKGLCPSALSGGPDVVYKFTGGQGQTLNVSLDAPFESILYVTTAACGAAGVPLSCSATGSLTIQGLAGGEYWLFVDGAKEKEWGDYNLTVELKN